MAYKNSVCVYSIGEGLELENKYDMRSKNLKFINYENTNVLFILTDTELYAAIVGKKNYLYLIANNHQYKSDHDRKNGMFEGVIINRSRGN